MSPAGTLSAERIAAAARTDPQLSVPRRPRLVDGLVVVALEQGLLVEGGAERQLFRGAASRTLLPRLLPLLDGSRGLDELAVALPDESLSRLDKAVALLYACGLLEEGGGATSSAPEVATFVSRHVDTTRANRHAAQALDRLARARVELRGPATLVASLGDELERAGIGEVVPGNGPLPSAATTLVVAAVEGEEPRERLEALDVACARHDIPWIRVAVRSGSIELGPRFERPSTACYRCFASLHLPGADAGTASVARRELAVALAAADVVWLLARVGTPLSPNGVSRLELDHWTQRTFTVPPVPGCPVCCPLPDRGPLDEVPVAYAYERSVDFPPRHLLNVKDHQHHYKDANLALQEDSKRYPSAPTVALGAPGAAPAPGGRFAGGRPVGPAARALDAATLAGLLLRCFGRRDGPAAIPGKVSRWAPTGGNLGSAQAYVLAWEVDGLSPGIYFYLAAEHALATLPGPRERAELASLAAGTGVPVAPGTVAALVLTGALGRVARKYATFAYRSISLDAGCALAQLDVVATGYGQHAGFATRWDDDALLALLALDDRQEPITGVVALGPRETA